MPTNVCELGVLSGVNNPNNLRVVRMKIKEKRWAVEPHRLNAVNSQHAVEPPRNLFGFVLTNLAAHVCKAVFFKQRAN